MATYKVLQDIEAEDKFFGPLTLKQFIFALVMSACLYASFWSLTRNLTLLLVILLPIAAVCAVFAWPWSKEQPTEIWLLAKLRFYFKPKRRLWNQDGVQQLVTITAPKRIEKIYTDNLSQTEVKSRLKALADTIDSRGWVIKNADINMFAQPAAGAQDDDTERLVSLSSLPKEVATADVNASDDMLDEYNNPTAQHLNQMIHASSQARRDQIMLQVQAARDDTPVPTAQPQPWFMQPEAKPARDGEATFGGQVIQPGTTQPKKSSKASAEEKAILQQIKHDSSAQGAGFTHLKVLQPLSGDSNQPVAAAPSNDPLPMTPATDPAILELANNDDLNVATIARQAQKVRGPEPPDEVVISLR